MRSRVLPLAGPMPYYDNGVHTRWFFELKTPENPRIAPDRGPTEVQVEDIKLEA